MIDPTTSSSSPLPYKDRKTGLIIFGVLTMGIGALVALLVPLIIFSVTMSTKELGGSDQTSKMIGPGIAFYGALAFALIWLGIGSTMARRWARALLLIFSWSWLIVGMISIAGAIFMIPRLFVNAAAYQHPGRPPLPASVQSTILVFILAFYAVFLVLLPAVWVWFYQCKNVKATCEARDPVTRWTDRCPLPVLAVSLWLSFGALSSLAVPLAYGGVFPFFGRFLSGSIGTLVWALIALSWLYAAWLLFKLQLRGWWIVLVIVFLLSISSVLTYLRHDITEMYRLMGYPEKQIAMIEQLGVFKGNLMAWSCLIFAGPFIAYLLFIRRYFRHA
jgi:hypothetical protein